MLSRPLFPTRLLALLVLCAPGCGLLFGEPDLPDAATIQAARAADQQDWELLTEAYVRNQEAEDPEVGLAVVRGLLELHPESVRLAFFAQDLAIALEGRNAVLESADEAVASQPTALNLLLRARLERDREQRYDFVRRALDLDRDLPQGRVMRLALEARGGEPEVLDRVIRLLQDYPASAEGWRLLGELAPLYDRTDLARAAALTEPWSPVAEREEALYALAVAELRAGDAARTLALADDLNPDAARTTLLRAAALASLERPQEALTLIDQVLAKDPRNAVAVFDRALLLRDYLGRHQESRLDLQRFLQLADEGADVPLTRRMQAELWLKQGPGS